VRLGVLLCVYLLVSGGLPLPGLLEAAHAGAEVVAVDDEAVLLFAKRGEGALVLLELLPLAVVDIVDAQLVGALALDDLGDLDELVGAFLEVPEVEGQALRVVLLEVATHGGGRELVVRDDHLRKRGAFSVHYARLPPRRVRLCGVECQQLGGGRDMDLARLHDQL
jgi:hypothetical protein